MYFSFLTIFKLSKFKKMMHQSSIKKIQQKFNELKMLDESEKIASERRKNNNEQKKSILKDLKGGFFQLENIIKEEKQENGQAEKKGQENIDTQSDIVKELAKLKPYLESNQNPKTSEEIEELKIRECSRENYKMMCELAIIENQKLCQILENETDIEEELNRKNTMRRVKKQDQGWIFEIFYRTGQQGEEFSKKIFSCGFAVMTENVQIFESLNFDKLIGTIIASQITYVQYTERGNYQVMQIWQGNFITEIGFLTNDKLNLFDRMLFLQKNMSRSTSTRLFQNQLLRSIYEEY